ncbi:hypothetical protein FZ025_08420 [Xanthomonas hyacinthi]|uniref:hypothetical protein n=1 Tax=Xanthomonas hyacinthi TaxID=56455 RepID=UPI0011B06A18|nr:hypothetical protein [Xanthomonas hyacinthi]QGY76675.1 hypothetical protein FZ025_08420 [Xanthomonas hyacinthi]
MPTLPSWLKFNVSTGQVKVSAKTGSPGATGTIAVAPDGTVSVSGGGVTSNGSQVKVSGNVSLDGGVISADSVTLQIPGPGGTSVGLELEPGGFVPHPTDPSAPPIPSAHVKAKIGVNKNFEFDIPLADDFTMDDLFDRETGEQDEDCSKGRQ